MTDVLAIVLSAAMCYNSGANRPVCDGLAWSMAINEDTGKLVLSAAGDGFAMVVFGACAQQSLSTEIKAD